MQGPRDRTPRNSNKLNLTTPHYNYMLRYLR